MPCGADGAAVVSAEILSEPANDDRHGAVGAAGDKEERGVFEVVVCVHREEDGKAGNGDSDWEEGEEEAVF